MPIVASFRSNSPSTMRSPILRAATTVAASHIILVAGATAAAVYVFDRFDAAWGRDYTWQVLCLLGVLTGVLAFVGALFGSIFAARVERTLPTSTAFIAGMLTAMLLGALLYLRHEFQMEGGLFGAVIGSILLPFAIALRMSRTDPRADVREHEQ
jgi:hypothetical protein